MKAEIKFIILLLFLFYGSYAILVVKTDYKSQSASLMRMTQMKNDLTEKDYAFMNMILNEDDEDRKNGNVSSSGSVIVKNGEIIGKGKGPLGDPISHAEVQAVRDAHIHLGTTSLNGCVLYSSTEPCPMCLSLLYLTNVDKIVYFMPFDTASSTAVQALNQRVYNELIRHPSARTIPEVRLFPEDFH
jgi:guanine deaminase